MPHLAGQSFRLRTLLLPLLILAAVTGASTYGCGPPSKRKIVVLGLDGLTWTFLEPLIRDHQLPNLEGVVNGAATGDLETFRPTKSGILWTSIATGKTMAKHGITDWTYVDKEAREEIERLRVVTGTLRTAAAIWEILSDKGYSAGVTNWWVTYPARPLNGFLITDRLREVMVNRRMLDRPDLVYPPELISDLKPLFLSNRDALKPLQRYGFPLYTPAKADQLFNTSKPSRNLYAALQTYVGQDKMVANWALHQFAKGQPDFFGVILRITDVFAHFGWRFADRATLERMVPQIDIELLMSKDAAVRKGAERLIPTVDQAVARAMLPAYKFADDFVGSIVSQMDSNSILVIVSDHGFGWTGGSYDHNPSSHSRDKYPKESPPGVIILKGPGIRSVRLEGARLFDVTPTILYALGEPVARDMDGRALTEAFSEGVFSRKRDERFVQTYGTGARPPAGASEPSAAEKEILEDLRGLGYIGGGAPGNPADPEDDKDGGDGAPAPNSSAKPSRPRKP